VKKETPFVFILCLFFLSFPLYPIESVLRLGGKEGFRAIAVSQRVLIRQKSDGNAELSLKDLQEPVDAGTDLFLPFDSPVLRDESEHWIVQSGNVQFVESHQARGKGSGAFFSDSFLTLIPRKDSFFSSGLTEGGFSIEFWLYPTNLEEGEGIFVWRKAGTSRSGYQEVSCSISGRVLIWSFLNFFQGPEGNRIDVSLRGSSPLVPREWRHHALRYDASTGMIEYLLDGEPDAVVYATPSGREDGSVYYPALERGGQSPLRIGEGYNGFMDEFRMYRRYSDPLNLKPFPPEGGWIETEPLDLGYHDTRVLQIQVLKVLPGDSAVFYYYRMANSFIDIEKREWIPVDPGKDLPHDSKGRFLQLRAELYPDGSRKQSPKITEIIVTYEPKAPPPPPSFVQAVPGDGEVLLRWSKVPDPSVTGYFVYYGSEPGVFKGNDSTLGPSPIKAGNCTEITISGLTNGKLYYFAISAYDSSEDPLTSRFSFTVITRPSRIYRNEHGTKDKTP